MRSKPSKIEEKLPEIDRTIYVTDFDTLGYIHKVELELKYCIVSVQHFAGA